MEFPQLEHTLDQRIHWMRWVIPISLVITVLVYQVGPARFVHNYAGHTAHYLIEICFYSLLGPCATWFSLLWIERWIRERRAVEAHAHDQERRLAAVSTYSADAILSINKDRLIQTWNQGATVMLGYEVNEIIGQPFDSLIVSGKTPQSMERIYHDLNTYGVARDIILTLQTADDRMLTVELTASYLNTVASPAAGEVSIILRDVTYRKQREEIIEEERARIARDLHDGLAQDLYFVGIKLDLLQRKIENKPVVSELLQLRSVIQSNIHDVRRTIFALRPLALGELAFDEALRQYIEGFAEQSGLVIELAAHATTENIPTHYEALIFRVIQESLNNVAKHASADRADISLGVQHQCVELTITDNGQGLLQTQQVHGFGLRQMRERVEQWGGKLNIMSNSPMGVKVHATLPL